MSNSSEAYNISERSARMNTPCSECGSAVPPRRKGTCSAPCKKLAKSRYDRERHILNREANIQRVSAWRIANLGRKQAYDAQRRQAVREKRRADRSFDWEVRTKNTLNAAALRAKAAGNEVFEVSIRDARRALHRTGNACAYCRTPFGEQPCEWERVIPISRGGRHSIGNLLPSCRPCNRTKMSSFIAEVRLVGHHTARRRSNITIH